MKSIFLNLPILRVSFFAFLGCVIFMNFFITPSFKSQSILDISSDDETISAGSVFDTFVSSGPKDVYQLKAFLTSEEASGIFKDTLNTKKLFSRDDISFFSKYRQSRRNSFHDYFQKKIFLSIDSDSNALIVETFAFSPKEAQLINLQLINMSSDFFNRKARIQSLNIKTSKICELYSINSDILNLDDIDLDFDKELVLDSETANQLLLSKSLKYKELCLSRLEQDDKENEKTLDIFPFFELKNINADASKQVLLEIYDKSLDSVTASNNLRIIAEPIIPSTEEDKDILLYSILAFVITFITILSLRILLRLNQEFET